MHNAYIALGGNIGDVLATFREALCSMAGRGLTVRAVSSAYRTPALMANANDTPGPDYWNAAAVVTTELAPLPLLSQLHVLEANAGRVRHSRWDARSLDLDLLVYDALVLRADDLVLPHPEMLARVFVLAPLAEIAPELQVPGAGVTVAQALASANAAGEIREVRESWFDAASFVS
jgi:2-amino-4-hydroxy-6-hydroxymethyldihydropteridine diphosphokinase